MRRLGSVALLQLHNRITARRRPKEAGVAPEDVMGGVLVGFQAQRIGESAPPVTHR